MNRIICHMTSINNLPTIISHGGLLSKSALIKTNVHYQDIANHDVQDKRAQTIVPLPPGGNLHHYVPFYFWGQTPMLLVNKHKQDDIIFFVAYTADIIKSALPFVFTDRHAVINYAQFYNKPEQLNSLDWNTIKLRQWANTADDPQRKEKKQAEFLIHEKVPLENFVGIAVNNQNTLNKVQTALNGLALKLTVKEKKEWYY